MLIASPFIPCPSCRATTHVAVSTLGGVAVIVTCKMCFEPGACMGSGADRAEAVEAWNAAAIAEHKARAIVELPLRETNIGRFQLLVGAGFTGNEAGLLLREMGFTIPTGCEARA